MKIIIAFLVSVCSLLCINNFTSCSEKVSKVGNPTTVGDISYDNDSSFGYRVYVLEETRYVPFLVLTNDYYGNCLLLRENLLDDLQEYNTPSEYGSYYQNSKIDEYLNDTYFSLISDEVKNQIVDTSIEITTKNAIDTRNKEVETISRKIFLLSANEVKAGLGYVALNEGIELKYFTNTKNRIARHENGEADTWMLRTPARNGSNNLIGVAYDGSVGIGGINGLDGVNTSSVRPAFCVPTDAKITQRKDVVEGQSVFCFC